MSPLSGNSFWWSFKVIWFLNHAENIARDLWSQVTPMLQVMANTIQQGNSRGIKLKNWGDGTGLLSALVSGLNITVIKFKHDRSNDDCTDTTISLSSLWT